jgi:parvulin-like peptidyl-prolyl isomerase
MLLSLVACLGALACSGPPPEVIATFRGGELTLSDLDLYVRALPEARRLAPPDGRDAWLEDLVHSLALERVLGASDGVRERLASPETAARRRWAIATLLAGAVTRRLAEDAAPSEGAVAERLAAAPEPRSEPLYNFRHVFLRLDRAASAAEEAAVRDLARDVARRARAGEDFAELARRHSQSVTAAAGGLVENQRPALLEESARRAIAALAEGEVSPVVETRTGLHVFRLERVLSPQGASLEQRRQRLRAGLMREAMSAARASLLAEIRQSVEVSTDAIPWRVGSFEVSAADLERIFAASPDREPRRELIVEQLLLAEAGRRRGLWTPELEAEVDRQLRREAIQAAYRERRAEHVAALPAERLRPVWEARPSAFAAPETARLDLIFVPQGRDVFATQRRLEDHVAELRAGASFAELARRISTGPAAAEGGDLGELPPSEWARLGPKVYRTVAAMEPGTIEGPVHLTGRILTAEPRTLRRGFAILRVRSKTPPRQRTLEEAIDDVRAAFARQNAAEIDGELRAKILDQAGFELVRLPAPEELQR